VIPAAAPAIHLRSPSPTAHNEGDAAVLDCVVEIKPPFSPTAATAQIADVLKSYGLSKTIGDHYSAEWVVDAMRKVGIAYEHSERDRSAIYLDALPMFTSGRVRLLENPRMVAQFAALERRTSPNGKDRVDHGPGGHDDICNSAALALVEAGSRKNAPMRFSDAFLRRAAQPTRYGRNEASTYLRQIQGSER
jgi:hypothetical protein